MLNEENVCSEEKNESIAPATPDTKPQDGGGAFACVTKNGALALTDKEATELLVERENVVKQTEGIEFGSEKDREMLDLVFAQIAEVMGAQMAAEKVPALLYSGTICGQDVSKATLNDVVRIINGYSASQNKYYVVSAVAPLFYQQLIKDLGAISAGKELLNFDELPMMITSPSVLVGKFVGSEIRLTIVSTYDIEKDEPVTISQPLSLMLNIKMDVNAEKRGNVKSMSVEKSNIVKCSILNGIFMMAVLALLAVSIYQSVTGYNPSSWIFGALMTILWLFNRGVFTPFFPLMDGHELASAAQVRALVTEKSEKAWLKPEEMARISIANSRGRSKLNTVFIVLVLLVLAYNLLVPGDFSLMHLFGGEPEPKSVWD